MAFQELKERHAFVWGNAPFENIRESIAEVHDAIVAALSPADEARWLDVACGAGGVTERALAAGAHAVVGVDIAPPLIEAARRIAAEQGLEIDYHVGDAEDIDFPDASFDRVSSSFGVMFAPDQRRAAAELGRVTRPGGRLGLSTWIPEGGIGDMFRVLGQFQPPPPEGAGAPLDWGRPEHVTELLGDAFELEFEERNAPIEFESPAEYWDLIAPNFGPMKTMLEARDEAGREEVRAAWDEFLVGGYSRPDGGIRHERQWLLVTGTRK